MIILKILCCLALGYAFGNISTAYIIGRINHIDIRNYGSGNAGTTNTLRTLGKKAGAFTFLGDVLKAVIPVLLVRHLIFPGDVDSTELLCVYTGLGVILGHNFPFWLKFKGGKGIAATFGIFLALHWPTAVVCLVVFAIIVITTKYVSLGSIVASIIADIWMIIYFFVAYPKSAYHIGVLLIIYLVLALWRHKANIVRLINGTENKIGHKKTSTVQDENAVFSDVKLGEKRKVTVLGAGTWGIALTIQLASNGHKVTLWSALDKEIDALENDRSNIKGLPGAVLQDSVVLTKDINQALKEYDFIVLAVASPFVRSTAKLIKNIVKPGSLIVNVAKGIEESSFMTLSEVINDEIPSAVVGVLSGPSHAEEVSRGIPTTVVAGAKSRKIATLIQDTFMGEHFRVYTSADVTGMEIGGALKNIIALAAGISDGCGFGDNSKAALMTRGLNEICKIGEKLGGYEDTFYGLSGLGDMIVTCTSTHSRNWTCGNAIGKGVPVKEAIASVGQVVEGVNCARAAFAIACRYKLDVPIIEQMNRVLFEEKPVREAVEDLFARGRKDEQAYVEWKD
ncbi:MAG: glycerol-3-phosphate 1-O-acyltransferase PlsY [Lachnospiraceae bacterium]|nr:glycerol-3-phosphate 1-O-acyltransferase PlsY [Lachnospiraceae bacterium]